MSSSTGGLWTRLHSAFERTDIGVAGAAREDPAAEDAIRPTVTRYAPIREAVERRVNQFLREDVVSHLEIGFNEIFLLHYIEIVADGEGAAELDQFLDEFSPESRVLWITKLLGGAVGRHVSVEQFLGLDREFTAGQLAEMDPFEEKLNQAATPRYRVILHGRWEAGPPAERSTSAAALASAEPPLAAGPRLVLSIRDGKASGAGSEARTVEIERFPAVVGCALLSDIELSGQYVSARHCTLHWDGESLSLTDHSTNGTWVDGERVRRGAHVVVANGALLGFGRDQGDDQCERYPVARVQLARNPAAAGSGATPVSPSRPTPVAPGIVDPRTAASRANAALAVLAIADANGSLRRNVVRLPFTIGRGSVQDYVVPDANEGVSREHLVIEEIGHSGAVTVNRAASRNGTFTGAQALPERFVWRFGQEIALGERWPGAPAVRVSLQPAGEAL